MNTKNYTDVIIAGKVYTLGGFEEEEYMQRVAGYLNQKYQVMHQTRGFLKQNPDYQNVLLQINIADDYFRAQKEADNHLKNLSEKEQEVYSIKQESITTQMKLESVIRELEICQKKLEGSQKKLEDTRKKLDLSQKGLVKKEKELKAILDKSQVNELASETREGADKRDKSDKPGSLNKDNITRLY